MVVLMFRKFLVGHNPNFDNPDQFPTRNDCNTEILAETIGDAVTKYILLGKGSIPFYANFIVIDEYNVAYYI